MLEWLKTILGDNYSEDTDKKVSEEIGKGFVAKADFTAAKEAKKTLETQLAEAGKTIEGFKAMDVDAIRAEADNWKTKAEKAEQDAAARIAELEFNTLLDGTITAAKGKNAKAIRALLDVDTLKGSKNQTEDAKKALDALREESGYLFESAEVPPPFAAGAGTAKVMTDPQSVGGEITKQLFGH